LKSRGTYRHFCARWATSCAVANPALAQEKGAQLTSAEWLVKIQADKGIVAKSMI
jgi:hypothetical protein